MGAFSIFIYIYFINSQIKIQLNKKFFVISNDYLISLWIVILLSCGENFLSSSRSVVFLLFFSVVYLDTPGERFSESGTERHSVHSKVTTILVPFLAISTWFRVWNLGYWLTIIQSKLSFFLMGPRIEGYPTNLRWNKEFFMFWMMTKNVLERARLYFPYLPSIRECFWH